MSRQRGTRGKQKGTQLIENRRAIHPEDDSIQHGWMAQLFLRWGETTGTTHLASSPDDGLYHSRGLSARLMEIGESSWNYNFGLGGESGFQFTNESSGSGSAVFLQSERFVYAVEGGGEGVFFNDLSESSVGSSELGTVTRIRTVFDFNGAGGVPETHPSVSAWTSNVSGKNRTVEDLLKEYAARKLNVERWQDLLEKETDPAQRKFLEDRIAAEQNILSVLQTEALGAGVTQQQLNDLDQQAANEADNNPIDLEEFDGGEYVIDDVILGGLFGGLQGGAAAIDGIIPFWDPLASLGAYDAEDSTLQGSQALGGFARNTLLVAAGSWAWNAARPLIAEFAAAEFTLPAFGFGGGGLALAGGGSTGGGVVSGSQILAAGAGILGGTALFMNSQQIDKIADHVFNDHPGRYPGQSQQQIRSRIEEILQNFSESRFGQGTRQIWRLGKDVLINDGKGGGTMFQPDRGAIGYMIYWLRNEFGG